ncbi:MAG: acyl-CoA synthetase [Desulfobacteraceae bacterium]|nr:acyl-CoA synthetase [Desulfobacteraceae bacterium]
MAEERLIRGIEDLAEIEKVPYTERAIEKSTTELLEKGAGINPDAPAISFLQSGDTYDKPMVISYRQFMNKIRQTANMFHDLGIKGGDVVTYILPNLPQTHYVLWGAEAAGIANPINPMLEPETIKEICKSAQTKVLVALGEMSGTDIWQKVEAIRKDIPTLEHVVRVMGPAEPNEKILGFDETVESYPADRYTFDRSIDPDEIASLYHTGGTTGTPKLARRSHYNEVVMAHDLQIMAGYNEKSTLLCGLPLFHCNGTLVTGLGPFSFGAHVVLLSPMGYRDPSIVKNFYKIVEKYQAETFSAVPTVLSTLLDIPVDGDLSSLKYAICGAAPLSVELFKRVETHTGMKILEGYGLTEGAVASAINPKDGERKVGSVGIRMPYQSIKAVILDENDEYVRDAKTDEIGAIAIKGPNVFKGYVEPAHNQGIWLPDGSFNTGDLGKIDADGYIWLTGREKELIIRGGHNIDPALLEEPIYKMAGVKTVAAVGRPDPYAGEVPVAYVELAEDADQDEEQIMEWAKQHVGEKAAVPKEIILTEEMPLTPVGKIFKPRLRWDATKRAYEKELSALGDMVRSVEVEAGEDKARGTRVTIRVRPAEGIDMETIKKKIDELLTRYTVFYTVTEKKE